MLDIIQLLLLLFPSSWWWHSEEATPLIYSLYTFGGCSCSVQSNLPVHPLESLEWVSSMAVNYTSHHERTVGQLLSAFIWYDKVIDFSERGLGSQGPEELLLVVYTSGLITEGNRTISSLWMATKRVSQLMGGFSEAGMVLQEQVIPIARMIKMKGAVQIFKLGFR